MNKTLLTLATLATIALPLSGAQAQIETYEIEKPHTQILFFVDHAGFSKSMGKFTDHSGTITYDRDNPANSSIEITIPTSSITLNDQKWDDHLKNEDFFNVETYPEMTFKSAAIEVTGEDTAKITGDLTLLDVTKPVTLDVTHNKTGPHVFGDKYAAGFSATAHIKRSEFGMTYGLPAVGDDVEIRLEVEAIRQDKDGNSEEEQ